MKMSHNIVMRVRYSAASKGRIKFIVAAADDTLNNIYGNFTVYLSVIISSCLNSPFKIVPKTIIRHMMQRTYYKKKTRYSLGSH